MGWEQVVNKDLLVYWPTQHGHIQVGEMRTEHWALINNYQYWVDHGDEIDQWLQLHGCAFQGMTIGFPSEEIANWFRLRWC